MEAPHPDGLIKMKVASVETRDIDIGAALRVLDPDRYAGGIGDGVWHKVTGLTAYHDFAVDGPGLKMTMTLLSVEDFKLRQPRHSFAAFLDRDLRRPERADHRSAIGAGDGRPVVGLRPRPPRHQRPRHRRHRHGRLPPRRA